MSRNAAVSAHIVTIMHWHIDMSSPLRVFARAVGRGLVRFLQWTNRQLGGRVMMHTKLGVALIVSLGPMHVMLTV